MLLTWIEVCRVSSRSFLSLHFSFPGSLSCAFLGCSPGSLGTIRWVRPYVNHLVDKVSIVTSLSKFEFHQPLVLWAAIQLKRENLSFRLSYNTTNLYQLLRDVKDTSPYSTFIHLTSKFIHGSQVHHASWGGRGGGRLTPPPSPGHNNSFPYTQSTQSNPYLQITPIGRG